MQTCPQLHGPELTARASVLQTLTSRHANHVPKSFHTKTSKHCFLEEVDVGVAFPRVLQDGGGGSRLKFIFLTLKSLLCLIIIPKSNGRRGLLCRGNHQLNYNRGS